MIKKRIFATFLLVFLLLPLNGFTQTATKNNANSHEVSGELKQGYRVLDISQAASPVRFSVYRGDYIKFNLPGNAGSAQLLIPELKVQQLLTEELKNSPYIKMKKTGTFTFSVDEVQGTIAVVEYDRPQYQALTVQEAAQIITNLDPVILDVRTSFEVARGKLPGTVHIPVQELQRRVHELAGYKADNILIYCATGNRSTVAAKILIDNGFKRIYNMRRGIVAWARAGYPVTR